MITTILFDLYGTLLTLTRDSKPYLKLAKRSRNLNRREALQLSLVNNCPMLRDYASMIGLEPQKDIKSLEDQLQRDLDSAILFNDALPVLRSLKENGIKTALISNLATPYKQVVTELRLDTYFDSIVYSCDFGYAKPDSKIYRHALNEVQSLPVETIMVGDSYASDVKGPLKLGIKGIQLVRESDSGLRTNCIGSLNEMLGKVR